MFNRMFGRRKSPVEGDVDADSAQEIVEQVPDETCDDFVVVRETPPQHIMSNNPPPAYDSLQGFSDYGLPYDVRPPGFHTTQRQESTSSTDMIRGVPLKFGSDVRIEGNTTIPELTNVAAIMNKINNFDWDSYEYNFKLERDVLEEYATKLEDFALPNGEATDPENSEEVE